MKLVGEFLCLSFLTCVSDDDVLEEILIRRHGAEDDLVWKEEKKNKRFDDLPLSVGVQLAMKKYRQLSS